MKGKQSHPLSIPKKPKRTKNDVAAQDIVSQGESSEPRNNKKKYTFYIDIGLMRDFKKIVVDENTNNSKLVETLLKSYVRRRSKP